MAGLQFNMTGLDQGREYVVFVGGSEAAESKLAKLYTIQLGRERFQAHFPLLKITPELMS